jgi:hypothetical protein
MAPEKRRFETKVSVLELNACLSSFGCTESKGKAFPPFCKWNATARTIGAALESNILGTVEHDSSKDIATLWMY